MIVIVINDFEPEAFGISYDFSFADIVFLAWDDVGVGEEYGRTDIMSQEPFQDGSGARGAAAVKQESYIASRNLRHYFRFLFLHRGAKIKDE